MSQFPELGLDPEHASGWAAIQRLGKTMVTDMMRHLQGVRERPAWRRMPDEVKERIEKEPLPQKGLPLESVYRAFVRDVLPYGGGNLHPRFWGWVMGNGTPGGVLAEMLAAAMNSNVWGGSQGAVQIELKVLDWCKQIMRFPASSTGILSSGCSIATLIGLCAARGRLDDGRVNDAGVRGLSRTPVVYASSEAHNSIDKAVTLLGLGRDSLRRIPVDEAFRMDAAALAARIDQDILDGLAPMAVVATAGTVGTGAIDPLDAVADVCRDRGVWLHVDGAFGALAVLDARGARLVSGIERADSLAFDFHKWLSVPYEAACVLIRDARDHARPFESQTAYLSAAAGGPGAGATSFGDLGPELSRGFRALKVWMSLREHGLERFGRIIGQSLEHARLLEAKVKRHPELELLAPVGLNVVCFRFRGAGHSSEADLDRINAAALVALQERGIAVPSQTRIAGKYAVRAAFVNHRTRRQDIEDFVHDFLQVCRQCLREAPESRRRVA
jgi:glutamate/tyrosine decarboxylase-like PLP-dependent enzyme